MFRNQLVIMVFHFPGAAFGQLLLVMLLLSAIATLATAAQAKPGCRDQCGSVSIPFPFGIGDGCYFRRDFNITCNNLTPFLGTSNIEITNISTNGELHVLHFTAAQCYNLSGIFAKFSKSLTLENFTISKSKNKFTVIGCDSYGYLTGVLKGRRGQKNYRAGCISTCYQRNDVDDTACSGSGCCQMDIADGLYDIKLKAHRFKSHNQTLDFNPCTYSLVVEQSKFNFSSDHLNMSTEQKFPVVLDWAIDDPISNSLCQENSTSYSRHNVPGYLCRCKDGYRGNPYLPRGCQDIDECQDPRLNVCLQQKYCINTAGKYTCSCPKGYHGDGRKNGQGCAPNRLLRIIVVGCSSGLGLPLLVIGAWGLYKTIKRRKALKLREKYFKRNGGLLLQQQLSSGDNNVEKTKLFSSRELEKATDHYNVSRILGQGGQGMVYKGMLTDGKIVAIKKSKIVDEDEGKLEQFINEIVILTQINHRNVVKLLGCCLETEVPLLVYEFIPNGTLFQYIHDQNDQEFPITWEMRLRIATEIAGAVSYLHSAASIPIYHRDIKSTNILLDDKYRAKVSDFGTSKSIAVDQTHVTTRVQGTMGYLDPEYFQTSQFTEKSDVYSFGVVLIELLTGQKPVSLMRSVEERSLVTYFFLSMQGNRLFDILDARVLKEGRKKEITAVAKLAKRCLHLNGKKRPTMKAVAMELEAIRAFSEAASSAIQQDFVPDEVDYAEGDTTGPWDTASPYLGHI